ncbi:MAG: PAS domain-containing protein [Chthoniobacter sp.]|uniref:PAS domain-containing protein n=1 Tax=Chthoniobacter sp. TaxID=2510640 RepID=UPI0032A4C26D
MSLEPSQNALRVVNQIPAMVGQWDADQRCVFANEAYREWFGRNPEEMVGMPLQDLLGPLYKLNLPYILGALAGQKQLFERQIPLPEGGVRETIASYTPNIVNGIVRGFSVFVADVSTLRERESSLENVLRERDEALAEVRVLRGMLSICSGCKSIRDPAGEWRPVEQYVSERTDATFSHGMCPACAAKYFPGVDIFPKE